MLMIPMSTDDDTSTLEDVRIAIEMAGQASLAIQELRHLTNRLKRGEGYAPSALLNVILRANQNFPEYWDDLAEFLDVALSKVDFTQDIPVRPGTKLYFGSFETFYTEMIEPWVGPLDRLQDRVHRLKRGEITRSDGIVESRVAAERSRTEKAAETRALIRHVRADNPDWTQQRIAEHVGVTQQSVSQALSTSEQDTVANSLVPTIAQRAQSEGKSPAWIKQRDHVAKRDPEMAARVDRGELTVSKAYRTLKPPDAYKELCKWWSKATENDRAAFENYIAEWRRNA